MLSRPLHSLEEKILRILTSSLNVSVEELAKESRLGLDQTRRGVEWLKEKGLIEISTKDNKFFTLGPEGKKAAKSGLPERRLYEYLFTFHGEASLSKIQSEFHGDQKEFSAALGHARRDKWIQIIEKHGETSVKLVSKPERTVEEVLLERALKGDLKLEELTDEDKEVLRQLSKRPNYFLERVIKTTSIRITSSGKEAIQSLKNEEMLEELTTELLSTGKWKGYTLRPLDVVSPAPTIYPGKKHPLQRFIDEIREIFVSLGFEEIDGPIIQPCFWNFDALFIPQDHPAREMQDTFYISKQAISRIDNKIVDEVSKVHVNGGNTGSLGWRYEWRLEEAKRLVLRTHTTAVTVGYLQEYKPSEARVFSIGRVFRNEKVSFKHLPEFYQIEGINVGRNVTLRDMMGLLTAFYRRLGLEKVKFWPSFFPYTEPSLQSMVYFDKIGKWVELCGMGIFRPEVTFPLGVRNSVLAWGGGLERLAMLRYGIEDIRSLYGNNLGWIRRLPLCQ